MKNINFENGLVFLIIVLFIGTSTFPSTACITEENQSLINNTTSLMDINLRGTLYVGGTGEGNYTSIQDAIDNATDGDNIFVYNGTYYEYIIINKNNISLIGENRETTILDAGGYVTGIDIPEYSNYNFVSGFTIRNTTSVAIFINSAEMHSDATSNYNTISDCIVHNCTGQFDQTGIKILGGEGTCHADYNTVINCIVYNTNIGISVEANGLANASNNNIINCICYDTRSGISLLGNDYSMDNIIANCTIYNNSDHGIYAYNNVLENYIYHNNLINNDKNAYDDETKIQWYHATLGEGNYYDDYSGEDSDGDGIGDIPYNIPGGNNKDEYPLMDPWGENPPVANFNYSTDNLTVLFDGSLSYDRDGEIISYEWDFGDGNNGTGMIVNHTYNAYGEYNVIFTVTDNDGYEGNTNKIIEVLNQPPDAPTIDGPKEGKVRKELCWEFHSDDINGDDVKYIIDWGDDNSDETVFNEPCTPVEVCHTYEKKGTYIIKAKAEDENGLISDESTFEVNIPRNRATAYSLLHWFLERFPLLERLLLSIRNVTK